MQMSVCTFFFLVANDQYPLVDTDPLEGHEESMTRRQLVATLAGDDVRLYS